MSAQPCFITPQERETLEGNLPRTAQCLRTGAQDMASTSSASGISSGLHLRYFASHFTRDNLQQIPLPQIYLTSEDVPALLHLLRHSPDLRYLNLEQNHFTLQDNCDVLAALKAHCPKLEELRLGYNDLSGCEPALGDYIRGAQHLRWLHLNACKFEHDSLSGLGEAVAASRSLRDLDFVNFNQINQQVDFLEKVLEKNRSLCHIGISEDVPLQGTKVEKAFLRNPPYNLLLLSYATPLMNSFMERNKSAAQILEKNIMTVLAETVNSGQATSQNVMNLFRYQLRQAACKQQDWHLERYQDFIRRLPSLPAQDGQFIDRLFTPDPQAYGMAPLDNPQLFADQESARAFLRALPLDKALLTRRTAHGMGVFDAVLMHLPFREVVEQVNLSDLSFKPENLILSDNTMSPLFQCVVESYQCAPLCNKANLCGMTQHEFELMNSYIPPFLKENMPSRLQISPFFRKTAIHGRGR